MTTRDNGGPAFPANPTRYVIDSDGIPVPLTMDGMTIRDWFAGQAMNGLISAKAFVGKDNNINGDVLVEGAYALADAMLVERSKP